MNQQKLINRINNLKDLPHSILLLGEEGSGQYEICEYISDLYEMILFDMSESITTDFINNMYLNTNKTLYLVNINKITDKEQNMLLKVYEEYNPFIYIIFYGEDSSNILDTIITRSYILNMDKYTREYLSSLILHDHELILPICTTPGQVEIANHTDIKSLYTLVDKIINNMSNATYSNALTISDKLNFSDEYNKYDFNLFLKVLGYKLILSNNYRLYDIVLDCTKKIKFMLDKKRYFEYMITQMWELSRVN